VLVATNGIAKLSEVGRCLLLCDRLWWVAVGDHAWLTWPRSEPLGLKVREDFGENLCALHATAFRFSRL
jgi:hypothetical protein